MKNNYKQFLLILVGFLLISGYIWIRYLRERLPRNIPFEPTMFNILLLFFICLAYILVIKNIVKPKNTFLIKFATKFPTLYYCIYTYLKILSSSLQAFDNVLKFNSFFKPYYIKLMYNIIVLFDKYINCIRARILIMFFLFFPQTILFFCLFIDIFVFKKLFYFYFAIPLTFFYLLFMYMIYSFKQYKVERLTFLNSKYQKLFTNYRYPFGYDEHEGTWDLKEFIEMQAFELMFENKIYTYNPVFDPDIFDAYRKEHNIPEKQLFTDKDIIVMKKDFYTFMPIVIYLELFLEYYYGIITKPVNIKKRKIMLPSAFLCCWFYILIATLYTLSIEQLLWITSIMPEDFDITTYKEIKDEGTLKSVYEES